MSAYLGTLSAFEVTTDTTVDFVLDNGQKIQLGGTAHYKVRRPNGFVIDVDSDLRDRRFIYDGKQFTLYAPKLNYYATAAAPPTIRDTLEILWNKFSIALPLEDLFRWSDPGGRADSLKSGFLVGPSTIDGVATNQYAFREGDIDWQVWIQQGDHPLPRKLVIVDRTDPADPAYIAKLTWNTNPSFSADDFTFKPGADDKLIKLSAVSR